MYLDFNINIFIYEKVCNFDYRSDIGWKYCF